MEFVKFKRRPFEIEAVQITEENMEELAKLTGEYVPSTDPDTGPYIKINKRLVPNVRRAYVGWWVTQMNDDVRCYAPKIFEEQFESADIEELPQAPKDAQNIFEVKSAL